MKAIPKWKMFLKYVDEHGYEVTTNECIDAGLVKDQKAMNNMLYSLENEGLIHWSRGYTPGGLKCYCINFTPDAKIVLAELDQPQQNEADDEGFAIEVNGVTVLSMSKNDAYQALEAIKTLANIFKKSVKED